MTVNEFITGYDKLGNADAKVKEKYIKKHITSDYTKFEDKINAANRIVQSSSYKDVDGGQMFHLNSPARYMVTMLAVYELYTDIEFASFGEITQFDLLERRGINDEIGRLIGVDYNRFMTVLEMVTGDMLSNTRDLTSFLETKVKAVGIMVQEIIKPMIEEAMRNVKEQRLEE